MFEGPNLGSPEVKVVESVDSNFHQFSNKDGIECIIEKLSKLATDGGKIPGSSRDYSPNDIANAVNVVLSAAGREMYQYDLQAGKMVNDPVSRYSLADKFATLPELTSVTRSNGLRDAVVAGLIELERSQRGRAIPRHGGLNLGEDTMEALANLMKSQQHS